MPAGDKINYDNANANAGDKCKYKLKLKWKFKRKRKCHPCMTKIVTKLTFFSSVMGGNLQKTRMRTLGALSLVRGHYDMIYIAKPYHISQRSL